MKKISFFLALFVPLFLLSCSEESPTTYTVKCGLEDYVVQSNLTFYEYNAKGKRIASHQMVNARNQTETYTADENAEKVKVFIDMSLLGKSGTGWIQQVYYLKPNANIVIAFNGYTIIGPHEP